MALSEDEKQTHVVEHREYAHGITHNDDDSVTGFVAELDELPKGATTCHHEQRHSKQH